MATFPAIAPDHPAVKELKVREVRSAIGDGGDYVTRFGLNPIDTTWRLSWKMLEDADRATIEAFLQARAADGQPFEWTPPDAAGEQRFRCETWAPSRSAPTRWALDLVFERVYEVSGAILPPEPITCTEDAAIPDVPEEDYCTTWIQPTWDETVADISYEDAATAAYSTSVSGATALSAFGLSSGKWYVQFQLFPAADYTDIFVGFAQNSGFVPGFTGSGGFGVAGSTGVYNDLAGGSTEAENQPTEVESGGNYYRADNINSTLRLALAIDFNAKKAWLGIFEEAFFQWNYDGDPVAGTGAMRAGWDGSPSLRIAVGMPDDSTGVAFPFGVVVPESEASLPPSGYCYWPSVEPA